MLFGISITIFTLIYFYIYILFVIFKIICLYNPNFNGHFKYFVCPSEVNLPVFHMLYYIQIIFTAFKFKLISIIEHLVCFVLNLATKMIFFFLILSRFRDNYNYHRKYISLPNSWLERNTLWVHFFQMVARWPKNAAA